jgi:hypothetical protein
MYYASFVTTNLNLGDGPECACGHCVKDITTFSLTYLCEAHMRNTFRLASGAALIISLFAVSACDDDDDDGTGPGPTTFTVTLTKAAETTVCAGAGANATGTATVTINSASTQISVTNLTFTGLSGPATMAHIHSGAPGVAGNIVIDFLATPAAPLTSPFNGTFTATNYIAAAGAPATFTAFLDAMRDGNAYINIHTAACGAGEIRGNLPAVDDQ